MNVYKHINLRIFYKKILFPFSNMEIPEFLRGQSRLVPGDSLIVVPVWNLWSFLFPSNRIGTLAKVTRTLDSRGIAMVEIRGINRVNIKRRQSLLFADCSDTEENIHENSDMIEKLRKKAQEFVFLIDINESDRLIYLMNFISSLNEMTDFLSNYFISDFRDKLRLLNETDVNSRSNLLLAQLDKQLVKVNKLKNRISLQ
ncbi:MAG: LON peptidase substrate-binding domain-containing protein [Spirochaetes bacterium]|nr:LON peptidase substrate-binding domain-containing protein [Spirochaetota bacterium]